MRPAVRTVCNGCLQSLEIASGEDFEGRSSCPYCGTQIDHSKIRSEAMTGESFRSPPPFESSDPTTPKDDPYTRLLPGRIARFVIREPLGEGGYGQVYRAYDPHLDRDVALKVLKPNRLGEKAMERFYREARAAARLDHPNIVGLHDAGCDQGQCWIAYQLVPGRTLSLIRDLERPKVEFSIRIVRDLALALEHAHGRGVYHRDLKPANVLVDDSGRARLTDFGLARRGDIDSDLTREGTVLGTPQYMSPEAAAGRAHEADGRSDVYSMGVILYELLCGRRPGDIPSDAPLWRSNRITVPQTPRSVDRAVPIALNRICMKALAHDPAARYPSARALADALSRHLPAHGNPALNHPPVHLRDLVIGMVVVISALCLVLGMSFQVGSVADKSAAIASDRLVDPVPVVPIEDIKPSPPRPESTRVSLRPAADKPAPPVNLMEEPVVRSRGSKENIFHRKSGCQHIKGKDSTKLIDLGTVREALEDHFRPCQNCLGMVPRPSE